MREVSPFWLTAYSGWIGGQVGRHDEIFHVVEQ